MPRLVLLTTVALAATGSAQTWTKVSPNTVPSPRDTHEMTYDPVRKQVVMFGGFDRKTYKQNAETWVWDGVEWSRLATPRAPNERENFGMAADGQGGVLLFGGYSFTNGLRGDTWRLSGTTWSQLSPKNSPARRRGHRLVATPRGVLLFGGHNLSRQYFVDTVLWNGTDWVGLSPKQAPSPRAGQGMAYDSHRGVVVLFGGGNNTGMLNDTWEWDGTTWIQRTPKDSPPKRGGTRLVYDSARRRMVLFGGSVMVGNQLVRLGDTWEYDGSTWKQIDAASAPAPRSAHAAAWHAPSGMVLIHGGRDQSNLLSYGDTWAFGVRTPASYTTFGSGCRGTGGIPALAASSSSLPRLGSTFTSELTPLPTSAFAAPFGLLGTSKTNWQSWTLPLDLGFLGAQGCSILVSPDLVVPLVNRGGSATWQLPIPISADLLSKTFHQQGLVMDRSANALGVTLSNGGTGLVGY